MSDDDVDEAGVDGTASVKDPSNPIVLDKYKKAAIIAHSCIAHLLTLATPSTTPLDLCTAGDAFIEEEVKKAYTRDKKIEKGVAFPTCVSVNHVVGHHSPLSTSPPTPLKPGDLIKLDLAVHIDGFIAAIAHTALIPPSPTTPSTPPTPPTSNPRLIDLITALSTCHDAILRCLRPGQKSTQVTDVIARVCREYRVQPVQGVLSHSLDRFVLDGPSVVLMRDPGLNEEKKDDTKVEEFDFKLNQLINIDLLLSTGDGKPKSLDDCTIYKRNTQSSYQLKMKVSRSFLSEVDKRSPIFPFTLRSYDESKAKFAIKECKQHDLVYSYPVLVEKADIDLVAQCKFVVWITERGAVKLCGLPVDVSMMGGGKSEFRVTDEEVKKLLNQGVLLAAGGTSGGAPAAGGGGVSAADKAKKNAKKKAKKAAKKAADASGGGGGEDKATEDKDEEEGAD